MEAIAEAARTLVGAPFRLHGRCREGGVDCVGLALLSARGAGLIPPEPPPYALRAGQAAMLPGWMRAAGFVEGEGARPGDIVLARVGPLQPHLLVDAGGGLFVHAHAGIGRVVIGPMPREWTVVARWRHQSEG